VNAQPPFDVPDASAGHVPDGDAAVAVARLWNEHLATPFPDRLRGVEPGGVDVVMADANLAGCVVTWQLDRQRFDDDLRPVARALLVELDRALPQLTIEAEIDYCARLRELARLVSGDH
jgi:hypothetical protein